MKFYMAPGSCSTGIHILLEELDLVFEVHIVNLPANEHKGRDYLAINPKSTIPTLVRGDGSALTEFPAIAWWLARHYPRARLLPESVEAEARVLELLSYIVGTVHMQGFARIFATSNFTNNPAEHDAVRAKGEEIVSQGFLIINDALTDGAYAVGEFSIADAALFYIEFWADKLNMELPPRCRLHYQRMLSRPVVRRVLLEEGYRLPDPAR
ncbi:glutathione S-transferase family protein [Methylotetracoccus oryzae]|uniref:glutathione S-transferase family protein n=1 Tax=Methylotetracoccus oryzae TaxID=1919059 RepID=UPI00111B4A83|nr:glutathione S-transferase [Methylotetracoccus oryzae]